MAAVGTLVVTKAPVPSPVPRFQRYTLAWTCSAAGAVSGNPFDVGVGPLWQATFIPSGTSAPSDLYDITLVDANGVDVLVGKGANLSATVPSIGVQQGPLSILAGGTLDLVVANAGNAKSGTVILLMSRALQP